MPNQNPTLIAPRVLYCSLAPLSVAVVAFSFCVAFEPRRRRRPSHSLHPPPVPPTDPMNGDTNFIGKQPKFANQIGGDMQTGQLQAEPPLATCGFCRFAAFSDAEHPAFVREV